MKCNNCGNIFDGSYNVCPLCKSTNVSSLNNNNFNINNNYNTNINVSNNINNNINNNVNNSFSMNNNNVKKKSNIFNIYIIFNIILVIGLVVFGIVKSNNMLIKYSELDKDSFINYFKDKGYKINDLKDNYINYNYIDNYYISSFNNRSYIYITGNDSSSLDKLLDSIKVTVNKYNRNINDKIVITDSDNIYKYELITNNKYGVIVRVDNMIIYSISDIKYMDEVVSVINDLGYKTSNNNTLYIYLGISLVLILIMYIISMWKILVKSNRKGFISLIPIYNIYVLNNIIIGNRLFFIFSLIPIINIIYFIYFNYKLGMVFGVSKKYIILLILFPIYFVPYIANSDYKYLGIMR